MWRKTLVGCVPFRVCSENLEQRRRLLCRENCWDRNKEPRISWMDSGIHMLRCSRNCENGCDLDVYQFLTCLVWCILITGGFNCNLVLASATYSKLFNARYLSQRIRDKCRENLEQVQVHGESSSRRLKVAATHAGLLLNLNYLSNSLWVKQSALGRLKIRL